MDFSSQAGQTCSNRVLPVEKCELVSHRYVYILLCNLSWYVTLMMIDAMLWQYFLCANCLSINNEVPPYDVCVHGTLQLQCGFELYSHEVQACDNEMMGYGSGHKA